MGNDEHPLMGLYLTLCREEALASVARSGAPTDRDKRDAHERAVRDREALAEMMAGQCPTDAIADELEEATDGLDRNSFAWTIDSHLRVARRVQAALAEGPKRDLMAEIEAEILRLGGDAGYEGREGLENLLGNVSEGADLARDEQGEELRASVLSDIAFLVMVLRRVDQNLPADRVDDEDL